MDRAVKCGACNVVNKKVNVNATQFKCSTCGTMNAISPQARAAAQKKARNIVMVIGVVIGAIVIWSLVSGGSSKGFTASVVGSPSCIARQCQLTIEVYPKDLPNPTAAAECTVTGDGQYIGTFATGPFSAGNGKSVKWLTPQLDTQPQDWAVSCK